MMESVGNGESKLSPSAAGKKLKQTRLPFQLLTGSPTAIPATPPGSGESRKRKISSESAVGSLRASKVGRTTEAKENVKDAMVPPLTVELDLDEQSNGSDVVNVPQEDQKLLVAKVPESPRTPTKREAAGSSGLSGKKSAGKEKGDRFVIKLPTGGKKKAKKEEEGDSKKVVKEKKKKHNRDSKADKEEYGVKTDTVEEPVVIDDSDDSEDNPKCDKTEETSKTNDEQKSDNAVVTQIGATEENEEKSPEPKNESCSDEDTKASQANNQEEPEKSSKTVDPGNKEVEKKNDQENANVTPRRGRSSRITAQNVTPKQETSAKKILPASQKKSKKASEKTIAPKANDEPNPEPEEGKHLQAEENQDEEDVPAKQDAKKLSKGALDKFFAKVDGEKKENQIPEVNAEVVVVDDEPQGDIQEVPKTPVKGINTSIAIICQDDSTGGNGIDDEENAYMLCTPNTKERSLVVDKKLTPKQLARQKEADRKQALKQQELEEKKRKKQEEKEAKQREKDEQELLKKKEREEKEEQKRKEREEKEEQKRKEREEKEEQKRKEKEEKEKKRLAELEAKNEEKRKKEEQKEEERKKKEEEKEAEEKRKQKTAQAFQSFFVKKANGKEAKHSDDENSMEQQQFGESGETTKQQMFMPFCVKGDMRLAPVCRVTLPDGRKQHLDNILKKSSDENGNHTESVTNLNNLYLKQLKNKDYIVGKSGRMWAAQDDEGDEDDVMVVDDNLCHQIEASSSKLYRAKFFLFEENRRPPYRGTWRKQSATIKSRRPFAQDTKIFDYEVDSDDEWEEEEPGESLHGSDDEKDVDTEDDYEVDNDFFVPHGHLSDEELQAEDDVLEDNSPEAQKAKLKIMQQEFAAEMKKKTQKIKPRLLGCLWENTTDDGEQRSECSPVIWEILKARAMLFDPEEPISLTVQQNDPESNQTTPSKEKEPVERKLKQIKLVDEGVKELITLIHGCAHNRKFLIKEFLAYWAKRRDEGELYAPQFAPDSIRTKILEISSWRPCPDEGVMQNKMCWYVNKDTLKKYDLIDLKVPTEWKFILKPIIKSKKERKDKELGTEGADKGKKTPPEKRPLKDKETEKESSPRTTGSASKPPKTPAANIAKFTKKLSEDDKRKQLTDNKKNGVPAKASPSSSSKKSAKTPKRKSTASASRTTVVSNSSTSSITTIKPSEEKQQPPQKKRVALLMSVPRGQQINQTHKNSLISKFLSKPADDGDKQKRTKPEAMEVDPPNGREDVIVLDD
ncbi:chromatin assembly factor 1 subunit A [Toxorhynchites rutilus septentrionalis]|uniref:chromatin assembly factor 1 subunit A n=1 Tax=Toxorhynchites rutilus septentrionalis TaxID=329112 RepID=UPI002479A36D|nr:chromatin assembly factor 1 subunit A [Toxorhynchites rutilus septentrionalis]